MKKTGLSGVTLVELLVYMTILSLVTIGVTQMVLEIQKANVQTVNLSDQYAESDLTLRRVQVKLGNSDDVEVVELKKGTGDNACLRLKTYKQYTRKGVRFDGRNQYIRGRSADRIPISGSSPRTMSAWVRIDPDFVGVSTVAYWGNGGGREFGIDIRGGTPEIRFNSNCLRLRPQHETYIDQGQTLTRPIDLRDGGWHHIAVTFSDAASPDLSTTSAKIYIDGKEAPAEVPRCESQTSWAVNTTSSTLVIGGTINDRQSSFKGLISDLRIWNRSLYPTEVAALALRDPAADANTAGMLVSMPLDNFQGRGLANRGSWTGAASMQALHMPSSDLVKTTLVDQTAYHSFCMIDDDSDGLHELWESETALNVPDRVGGDSYQARSRTWDKRSEDMFVPGPTGFFKVVGRDPESVIANFAVGKGIGDSADLTQKAQSKQLATTRWTAQPALCAIDIDPLTIPRTCLNSFKQAYVVIEDYVPKLHGRLDLLEVDWTKETEFWRTRNIPNMPADVNAYWYPRYGILKFASPTPIEDKYWQRAMGMTLYRPSGRSSDATVTFSFGVGDLPFFDGSNYRFFRFIDNHGSGEPTAPGQPIPNAGSGNAVTFDEAVSKSAGRSSTGPNPKGRSDACGLNTYLATITTEAEHNHLTKVMMVADTPGWQSGWIGGRVLQNNVFSWVTGPVAEQVPFWHGTGQSGRPYRTSNGQMSDIAGRSFFDYDPLPQFGGNRRQIIAQSTNDSFRFANWAGGKEYQPTDTREYDCDSTSTNFPPGGCQPASSRTGEGVAIYGHKDRNGTWFSVPNVAQRCDPTAEHSICGYYVEFEEPAGEDPMKFAHQISLDMSKFREFCQSSDNVTR